MIRNFLTIAWRNLFRNKTYTVINLLGFSIGMATAILIGLWVKDELTFNKTIIDYDRVVQVMHHWESKAYGTTLTENVMPVPAANELREKYMDDFESVALAKPGDHIFSYRQEPISLKGYYAEPGILNILSPNIIEGTDKGFDNINAVLIGERASKSLFGSDNPINQLVTLDNNAVVKVIGVFADFESNTSFAGLDFIQPWSYLQKHQSWVQQASEQWNNNSFRLYAKLKKERSLTAVNHRIEGLLKGKPDRNDKPRVFIHPMDKWHLYDEFKEGKNTGGNILYVRLFLIICVFILLLACINFMNLSTARAQKRAKEVGIRKTIGSTYRQLTWFFFVESILTTFIASLLAILLVYCCFPWFNQLTGKNISIPYTSGTFWLTSILFVLLTGILAGSYPALYLSSFNPIKSLKGTFDSANGANRQRKVLVVMQFTISFALIVGTLVVYQQVQYAKNRPIGYDANGLITVEMKTDDLYKKYELISHELLNSGAAIHVAEASNSMTDFRATLIGFDWKGKDPGIDPDFNVSWITQDFGTTVGWQLVAGRDFSPGYGTDSSAMILNEAAARYMQLSNPINETVRFDDIPYTVVGVIKNIVTSSPYQKIMPAVYILSNNMRAATTIRLNPKIKPSSAITTIARIYKKYVPSVPFDYSFVDDDYARKFAMEERVGRIASCFAGFALLISCMGIFGLAVFMTEQRTKEIGVRKVLGATVTNLWVLLSADFTKLVFISFALAIPLSTFLVQQWLDHYDYRLAISPWLFVLTAVAVFLITLITVSFQTVRTAKTNPIDALRNE
ncbi:ABC transporter permease [Olivibacter sp. CPCC 100613]|uniref:ABC transporter permease n=1 Tax=Olivibacter sp. CPCC 100613 TaxID=3079931 RepID=UPI002FFA9446